MPAQQRPTVPTQTIDFNAYISNVRRVYNKYSGGSSRQEYDKASDAIDEIEAIVKTIRAQSNKVSFAGKQDAISAIADIAWVMLEEGGSELASEIQKSFYWGSIGDAVEGIVDSLSPEEIAILQEDGELMKQLLELSQGAAAEHAIDIGLDKTLAKRQQRGTLIPS